MPSTYELFQNAERLEVLSAELYYLLAERFSDDERASSLFRRLGDEEVQHAARVRLLAAQYRNDPRVFEGSAAWRGTVPDIEATLQAAADDVEQAAADRWGRDLEVILERLIHGEERCAAFHAYALARGAKGDVARFFEELARQDREHNRLLGALLPVYSRPR